jgi:hypothetical protein
MNIVVSALKAAGHTILELPSDKMKQLHRQGTSCVMKSNVQNGGRSIMKHIAASGEPVVPRTATGSAASILSSEEVFANHEERRAIAAEYGALWNSMGFDAILSPAVAHPASPHGKYISNAYAGIYNMLDYVTGSIPVTTVSSLDEPTEEWSHRTPYPRIEAERFPYDYGDAEMKELCKPISNQVVSVKRKLTSDRYIGKRFRECTSWYSGCVPASPRGEVHGNTKGDRSSSCKSNMNSRDRCAAEGRFTYTDCLGVNRYSLKQLDFSAQLRK